MTSVVSPKVFNPIVRWGIALCILVLLFIAAWFLDSKDSQLSFSLLSGAAFGYVIQRSRFCFYCISRDFIERRESHGLLGLVVALAAGLAGYHAVFGIFVPDATSGRLPPGAHIGAVSWMLVVGASFFGVGMALAGSCISAVLYRLGEGAFAGVIILPSVLLGFLLGFYCWNSLYLEFMQQSLVLWLPAVTGYGLSLFIQLTVLALLAALLLKFGRDTPSLAVSPYQAVFIRRWPAYVGGILVAFIATLAYLRVAPLGVTAELGSISRSLGARLDSFPQRLEGLDSLRGCATVVKQALLSNNGVFVLALVAAAFAAALPAGDFKPSMPKLAEWPRLIVGGVFMGFGAMLALGCTVGVLLSGIMASALSGWIFLFCCSGGLYVGWWLRRKWSF